MANRHEEPAYPHQQFSQDYLAKNGPQKPLGAQEMPENGVVEVFEEVAKEIEMVIKKVEEDKTPSDSILDLLNSMNKDND